MLQRVFAAKTLYFIPQRVFAAKTLYFILYASARLRCEDFILYTLYFILQRVFAAKTDESMKRGFMMLLVFSLTAALPGILLGIMIAAHL